MDEIAQENMLCNFMSQKKLGWRRKFIIIIIIIKQSLV